MFEEFNNKVCCLILFLEQEVLSMSHVNRVTENSQRGAYKRWRELSNRV